VCRLLGDRIKDHWFRLLTEVEKFGITDHANDFRPGRFKRFAMFHVLTEWIRFREVFIDECLINNDDGRGGSSVAFLDHAAKRKRDFEGFKEARSHRQIPNAHLFADGGMVALN
jgi:hypothetical protein